MFYAPFPSNFDMPRDYLQNKNVLTFDPRGRVCVCVCKDRMYACMVFYAPFLSNLICHMTTFRKALIFHPYPRIEGMCKDRICACTLLPS